MKLPPLNSPKTLSLSGAVVVILVAATLGIASHYKAAPKPQAMDFDKFRQEMQRTDLTEEQRHALAENMRNTREAQLDEAVEEYYNAPPEDKERVLDKRIDQAQEEWKRMQAEWEKRRAEREQQPDAERDRGPTTRPWRGPRDMSPQEQKVRSETRNPDQMARRMAYFAALTARMQARGIQGPWGGGPGRGFGGGPGHGPGPGGGGHGPGGGGHGPGH